MNTQTVVVVDDSPTVVKFVSFTLKNGGYKVITACDGMDALEKISNESSPVNMVITDLNMPNMDGYTLIETLRKNKDYMDTPIIILSSEEEEEDMARGKEAGASAYLVKPFQPQTLLAEVERQFMCCDS